MGAAAVAQIPLTHRRASSALVFITAHQAPGSEAANWSKLAGSGATLVIYMPGQNYSEVAAKLRAAGLAGDTPCAVISRATTPQQQTHRSTITELHGSPKLAAPTLLVVGEVVRFADPVSLVQHFSAPQTSAVNDSAIPAARFATSDFGTNEEPLQ
jgi:siroheme synthase